MSKNRGLLIEAEWGAAERGYAAFASGFARVLNDYLQKLLSEDREFIHVTAGQAIQIAEMMRTVEIAAKHKFTWPKENDKDYAWMHDFEHDDLNADEFLLEILTDNIEGRNLGTDPFYDLLKERPVKRRDGTETDPVFYLSYGWKFIFERRERIKRLLTEHASRAGWSEGKLRAAIAKQTDPFDYEGRKSPFRS